MPLEEIHVIDGHYLLYRSFFAFGARPLTNGRGQRVETAFVIANLLQRIRKESGDATGWAFALDTGAPTFRHEAFPEYKGNREAMPEELVEQLPFVERLLEGYRIPVLREDGFEADDLLATIAAKGTASGLRVWLHSKDKDLEQVLSDQVSMVRDQNSPPYGPDQLLQKRDIRPDQVVEYQAMVGDPTDNIPGVAGIGAKTAVKILKALESTEDPRVESLFGSDKTLDGVTPRMLSKLQENEEAYRLSLKLVTLLTDAPVPALDEELRPKPVDADVLRPLFNELGFRSLSADLESLVGDGESRSGDPASPDPSSADPKSERGEYALIEDTDALDALVANCRKAGLFAFDTETNGVDPIDCRSVGFAISCEEGKAFYISTRDREGELLSWRSEVLSRLGPLLSDASIGKVGHHLKFDGQVVQSDGLELRGIVGDTMVAAYLLQSTSGSAKLDALVAEFTGHRMIPITDLLTGEIESMEQLKPEDIVEYAAEDADFTLRLSNILDRRIEEFDLGSLYRDVECPLIEVLVRMERSGIALSVERLSEIEEELETATEKLEEEIFREAGEPFTISSTKQLQKVLFEDLGLPPSRKTKTGYSTSAEVLEELVLNHPDVPLPRLILEHRSVTKLLSTYVRTLPKLCKSTGKIHTDFRQTVAATGRLASNRPNLQNIPIKSEQGRRIRRAFVPSSTDGRLVSADYSQIELRLLAHLSEDPRLTDAMRRGVDIHTDVAAAIHGKSADNVTREERAAAKAVNFGVIYGMQAFGLSRDLGISRSDAQAFIDRFFAEFSGVKKFIDETIARAEEELEVRTIFGRRRPVPELVSRMERDRRQGQRVAVNTVVQGSAADLIKKAMIDVDRDLRERNSEARLLLQIHDELVLECPASAVATERDRLIHCMREVYPLSVPLEVNVSVGEDWYDASK